MRMSKKPAKKPKQEYALLTVRVSRDSGKTWEPKREVRSGDKPDPLISSAWPLCECARCLRKNQ